MAPRRYGLRNHAEGLQMQAKPLLLQGGHVVTLDPEIGDIAGGDVLIEGSKIAAVGKSLEVPPHSEVVDASSMIVMPGFIDSHRHAWQTALRTELGVNDYFRVV